VTSGSARGCPRCDRSRVTVAALVALYRPNELPFHLGRALENGVTKDELIELITHLAFYGGWPAANTAVSREEGVRRSPGLTNRPRPAGAFHASLGGQPLWSEPLFE
jgi:carboxymuconolactone decarboxylase family protein